MPSAGWEAVCVLFVQARSTPCGFRSFTPLLHCSRSTSCTASLCLHTGAHCRSSRRQPGRALPCRCSVGSEPRPVGHPVAVQRALDELQYGSVVVNSWSVTGFITPQVGGGGLGACAVWCDALAGRGSSAETGMPAHAGASCAGATRVTCTRWPGLPTQPAVVGCPPMPCRATGAATRTARRPLLTWAAASAWCTTRTCLTVS